MSRFVAVLATAFVLVTAGCAARNDADKAGSDQAVKATPAAPAGQAVDAAAPTDPAAEAKEAAQAQDQASMEAAAQSCLRPPAQAAPANEKPPTNAKGFYVDTFGCWGCERGWWRTAEPIALRAAPAHDAALTRTLPPETWVFVRDSVSFSKPVRGVVVNPGGNFKACDVVYYLYPNVDDDEGGYFVWRHGKALHAQYEADYAFRWDSEPPLVQRAMSGWWVRVEGQSGENGWAWATADGYEFSCKWERDRETICDSAPTKPPR